MSELAKAAVLIERYLAGEGDALTEVELKAFQRLVIRESKKSLNNDARQSYDFIEPTKDNPTPNLVGRPRKLNQPASTKFYQDLLQQVIQKINETQRL